MMKKLPTIIRANLVLVVKYLIWLIEKEKFLQSIFSLHTNFNINYADVAD